MWATKPEERTRLWAARHHAFWADKSFRQGAAAIVTDVCVPISRLAECVTETKDDIERSRLVAPIVGHVGDGNFHCVVLVMMDDAEEVAMSIRAAHGGALRLDPAVAKRLMSAIRAPRHDLLLELTPRELEVVSLVGAGKANKEVATELGISERTARTHVSNILSKLKLSSRTQVALWAVREGLADTSVDPQH